LSNNALTNHVSGDAICTITDVTSAYAVLGVMGPRSRELLSRLTLSNLDNNSFPFGTSQNIEIDMVNVLALRLTYVGELGWELYVPVEFAVTAYEALHAAGRSFGLQNAGYYAIECLRVEKGYRAWSHDISPDDTPIEAGLGFAVDWTKDFKGKNALMGQKQEGVKRKLFQFQFCSPDAYPIGGEPIFDNNKKCVVGSVTSAVFSHTLGHAVGMGYVNDNEFIGKGYLKDKSYSIGISGVHYPVKSSLAPSYDPQGVKVHS